jgi:hypothetical protein
VEAKQSEREYQLCHEEMAATRQNDHAQKQLMNAIIIVMLSKNHGDINSQPPKPHERLDNVFFVDKLCEA